jgi:hypothetical protein
LFKDSAALSQITTHKLRDNISVLEGSGGNIAVLTAPDGKVLIDGGIGASRPDPCLYQPRDIPVGDTRRSSLGNRRTLRSY